MEREAGKQIVGRGGDCLDWSVGGSGGHLDYG